MKTRGKEKELVYEVEDVWMTKNNYEDLERQRNKRARDHGVLR